jgi:flagellar biosynthesis protein FlhF
MTQTYRAATVQEAIRLAKAELGPDALILDVRRVSPLAPGQSREGTVEISAVAARSPDGRFERNGYQPVARTSQLQSTPSHLAATVYRALQRLGISPALADRLARTYEATRSSAGHERRSALSAVIGRRLAFATLPPERRPAIIALIGPTGVGKTSSIAKLACQFRAQGLRVALLGLHPNPVTASHLVAWATHLNVPYAVVRTRLELAQAITAADRAEAILIDTPGCNPYEPAQLKQLRDDLGSRDPIACWLTLAVTGDTGELIDIGRRFLRLNPTALLLTKLDETRRAATALALAEQLRLPLAGLATGPHVPDDLVPASPTALAELVAWTLAHELRRSAAALGLAAAHN